MPSPAKRSTRLTRAKESEEENAKNSQDVATTKSKSSTLKPSPSPSPTKARKASGLKSAKTAEEPDVVGEDKNRKSRQDNSLTTMKENDSAAEEKEEPTSDKVESEMKSPDASLPKDKEVTDQDVKRSDNISTPLSTPRRSSRAPVPSSRFKDMEVGLTPNSQKLKRSLISCPSGDNGATTEPSSKRSRKNSHKGSYLSPNTKDTENPLCSPQDVQEDTDSGLRNEVVHDSVVNEATGTDSLVPIEDQEMKCNDLEKEKEHDESPEVVEFQIVTHIPSGGVEVSTNAEIGNDDLNQNLLEGNNKDQTVALTELSQESSSEKTNTVIVKTSDEELCFENDEEKNKGMEDHKAPVSDSPMESSTDTGDHKTLTIDSSSDVANSTPQEVSVEEVGLSCQDGGIIVEETVHTYMDEKDIVIQTPDVTESLDASVGTDVVQTPKTVELSLDKESSAAISSSFMIKGQEVTLQERDGKMVAIVKIPSSFGSNFTSPSATETKQSDNAMEDQFSTSTSLKTVTLNATPSQKNRHGHIVNKKTGKQQFLTLSDQDQNSLVNISMEPTTMTSILKPKPESSSIKPNPKTLYGRVIKQGSGIEASPLAPSPAPASVIIKTAVSGQKVSLLSQSLKATSSKDCKPYSLLSTPSELLQKLKGDSGKNQSPKVMQEAKKATHLSSSPKKVVIITHPAKYDTQPKKVSLPSPVKDQDTPIEIAEEETIESSQLTDTSTISLDSEITTDSNMNKEVPEIPSNQVIKEVAGVKELDSDTCKVEEVVVPSIIAADSESTDSEVQDQDESSLSQLEDISEVKVGEVSSEDLDKSKEMIIDTLESYPENEVGENVTSDLLISEGGKSPTEETVISITDHAARVQVKDELVLDAEDSSVDKAVESITLIDNKGKGVDGSGPKMQKIKLVDNGVVYELQIVSDGESRAFQDGTLELDEVGEGDVIVKEELMDDEECESNELVGKSSLGTQTIYASKRGRPRTSDDTDSPVHKLATIVQEGGQKKHYYYVSVVPGKSMDGKYRRSVDQNLPGCIVNELGEYCCKECDYKTDKKANFYKHRRLHTGVKSHVCAVCKYQARTSSNLKRHMGIHDDIREFKCTQCSLSFRQKIHLERHIRYRHEEKRVKCPMCDYVCANEQPDLKMHIKRKHTHESGKIFHCPQCDIEVGSKRDLKQHLKFHKEGPELKLFCKECSFVTDCKSRLQRHLVVHSNVKPYHCGVCDYKATQKEHVVRHLRSQHKIEVNKPKRPWKKQMKQEPGEAQSGNSKGDFTCGDKIFACNHCTMRFAKLINLYKHLHTQHSDIMPAENESNYYCVVCEFSTSSKKNLLVHMRRHNMTDQTPPTHVYSCVLCRYVNPRRRNLFQHMRKKHNIDISTQVDIAGMTEEEEAAARQDEDKMEGLIHTDHSVFATTSTEELATTSNFDNAEGGTQVMKDNLVNVANMIKIEDLTRVQAGSEDKDATSLVIDNGDGTHLIQAANLMQHKAADAIEGLQALAGQAGLIIDEEVASIDKSSTIIMEPAQGTVIATEATLADGSIILSDQTIVEEQVTIDETNSEQIRQIVESVETSEANSGLTSLELTEEQLSSLHHGDIVQMEGQVYMVEIAPDPDSPDKQLLSFLPINQS